MASSEESSRSAAEDLVQRLPPSKVKNNLAYILQLREDLTEDLLNSVDMPLEVEVCPDTHKEFIRSEFNRDANSYRSPHSNKYVPDFPDGNTLPAELRAIEVQANEVFKLYMEAVYRGGVSSVYCFESGDQPGAFAMAVLIKKVAEAGARGVDSGAWDSIHVVEVEPEVGNKFSYKLVSTFILNLSARGGLIDLSGTVTSQAGTSASVTDSDGRAHIINIGNLIRDMEFRTHSELEGVYFSKTKDVVSSLRPGRGPAGGVAMHGMAGGGGLPGLSDALKRRQEEVDGGN